VQPVHDQHDGARPVAVQYCDHTNSNAKVGYWLDGPRSRKNKSVRVPTGVGSQRQNTISECVTFHTGCAACDINPGLACAGGRTRREGAS
jgi:hypothetical protein